MSYTCFRGGGGSRRKLYMEKRDPVTGALDFSDPQPPFSTCTEIEIARYYFRNCGEPERQTASIDDIRAWYALQGFVWRPKTW